MQSAGCGVVVFDVGPERAHEPTDEAGEGAVVQTRPALVQIPNQGLPHDLVLDGVGVDEFMGGSLPITHRVEKGGALTELGD
jgi:hypothetical protein